MKKIIETLENIWFNKNEINIYINSLTLWQTTASILWQKSKIPRSTAQYTCNQLVEKRLLNITPKWNSFLYSPEPPEKIISLLNKEYTNLEKKMENVHHIMPYLNSLLNPSAKLPKVKYYSWVDWIIDILEDIFTEDKEFYWVFNFIDDMHPDLEKYILTVYNKKRSKNNIVVKALINDNEESINYVSKFKDINRITLVIPKEIYAFDIWIHIYSSDKVVIYDMSRKNMIWVMIEDQNIRNTLFSLFKMWWHLAQTFKQNDKYKNITL